MMEKKQIKPFVKWVGGKSQLLEEISKKYPSQIKNYCEPFVGGGAVLFDVIEKFNPKKIMINDINGELVNAYKQIQNNIDELLEILKKMDKEYNEISEEKRKVVYYKKRNEFNNLIKNYEDEDVIKKAALFIFLNKTCFNGLYRVNSQGIYNVPKGKYKNPIICDEENLYNIHKMIKAVKINCGDFEECENFIEKNTFVYIDPPYRPLTETSSFTSYTKQQFDDSEQIRLGKFVDRLNKKGAIIVLSNSDPQNVDKKDLFFDILYEKYNITRVEAKRVINSKGSCRGSIKELLIANC